MVSTAEHNAQIVERRKILRCAFDLVRDDPAEKMLVNNLAGALGGRFPVTTSILETAQRIIDERADHIKGAPDV